MKKIGLLVLLALAVLPVPFKGETGLYNTISGVFWCIDEKDCMHEKAHYIDDSNGWISQSPEYRSAIKTYILVELKVDTRPGERLAVDIVEMIGENEREIYASVYEITGGLPPESLKRFYHDNGCAFRVINLPVGRLYYGIRNTCH